MKRFILYFLAILATFTMLSPLQADDTTVVRRTNANSADIQVNTDQFLSPSPKKSNEGATTYGQFDSVKYTLGPNDVVEIEVMRHPEFSGKFGINQESKLQYKFVGDMNVKGFTKKDLEDKLKVALTQFVVSPEVNVTIIEYGSKVFYVLGEVASPGQFVMKSESISLRDAIHLSGLPTANASMRKCRLITPSENGKSKTQTVNLYALLYYGDLRSNVMLKPGDIFYVPTTGITKLIRLISPVTTLVGLTVSPVESVATGKTAAHSLIHNKPYNQ
jgi:protein involved in polysaccharide export with SLBB domain